MQKNKSCRDIENGGEKSFSEDVIVVCDIDKSVELPEEIFRLGI